MIKNDSTQESISGYKKYKEKLKLKKEIAKLSFEFLIERNKIIQSPYKKHDTTRLFELTHIIQEKESLLKQIQHPKKPSQTTKEKGPKTSPKILETNKQQTKDSKKERTQ